MYKKNRIVKKPKNINVKFHDLREQITIKKIIFNMNITIKICDRVISLTANPYLSYK